MLQIHELNFPMSLNILYKEMILKNLSEVFWRGGGGGVNLFAIYS